MKEEGQATQRMLGADLYMRRGVGLSSALELVAQKSEGRGPGRSLEMQLQETTVVYCESVGR